MLAVADTGTGMPPEVRERAFEPFFTTKGPGAGSGLGLAMVYGFAKQSGGHVDLYSEVGRGTAVKLYLPRVEAAGAEERAGRSPAAAWPGRGETVLVAEDEPRGAAGDGGPAPGAGLPRAGGGGRAVRRWRRWNGTPTSGCC